MMNLYNNGTIHEFNDLFLELYPKIYNSSIPHRDRAEIIKSFAQDENKYTSKDFQDFKKDSNRKSDTYGKSYATRRR